MTSFSKKKRQRSRYRQLGLIGQGQFGRVFCAVHRQTGQLVALKNLERERFPTHKFLRELRFLLTLQHENIVTCQALEHTATGRYLVMDYCEGGTLRSLLDEEHRLHPAQSLKLVADMLAGLEHAHSQGIVHCDIKPENILLSVEQWGWTARISDFGIARLRQELAESPSGGGNTGSPAYMAPERFYGQYSPAADLYSVGILMFELLAGYRPFSGTPMDLMLAHLNRPLVLPDSIPAVFHPLLSKALQKLAARRFASAGEMRRSLVQAAADYGLGNLNWDGRVPQGSLRESRSITISPALPTVSPVQPLDILLWRSRSVVTLDHPTTALAIAPPQGMSLFQPFPDRVEIYRASGDRVTFQTEPTEAQPSATTEVEPLAAVQLPQPIQALQVRPQGCFAIADRAIYLLNPPLDTVNQSWKYQTIAQAEQDCLVAIEAAGRWLAVASAVPSPLATPSPDGENGFLTVQPLPNGTPPFWTTPRPVLLPNLPGQRRQLLHLAALDGRHLALVSQILKGEKHLETWIEVFNRRGDRLGCLTLPVRLSRLISAPDPYRLVACDAADPNALLMIDLKPFRVVRLGVEIAPKLLAAANWGYVLASAAGELLLLDDLGRRVGRFQAPAPPAAIALFATTGILLATQTEAQSQIHLLDLREMGADLLF
ncbi:serine/threonine-protein kinase [Thermoleptolyngbya sp.]